MKMAKASELDLSNAMEVCRSIESMTGNFSQSVPEGCHRPADGDYFEELDLENHGQCKRILRHLMRFDRGLSRVVYGCAVMLDPANKFVDPAADTIERVTPMAKPLVWVRQDDGSLVAGEYYYRNGEAYWRDEMVFADQAPPGYLYNVAAAKTECEAHHQARFLEQMAVHCRVGSLERIEETPHRAPMAKPLLWIGDRDIENEYLVRSQDRTGANWHAFVKGVFIGVGATRDEAKAMCEANSQARFLEQMA